MNFDPVKGHMTYAGWVIGNCDQVSLKSIKAARRYIRLYGWQKKERTRHFAFTDGVPCRLWDIDPWLTPVSLLIPQMWCKCMNYMNIHRNIERGNAFLVKIKIWPPWPQMTPDWLLTPKRIDDLKFMHMYVTLIHYEKFRRVSAF